MCGVNENGMRCPWLIRKQMESTVLDGSRLVQRKWTWRITKANFLSFVAISTVSVEKTWFWMMVFKNQVWPVRMERITDSHDAEVMKLVMLKSEIFLPLTGLSWYCLYCVYSVCTVDSGLLLRWFYGSTERELLNYPGFSVCPAVVGCKLQADSNGSYDNYASVLEAC